MSWPVDEDGAPITLTYGRRVIEVRAEWCPQNNVCFGYAGLVLTEENLGVIWARGWGTKEADALRVAAAL